MAQEVCEGSYRRNRVTIEEIQNDNSEDGQDFGLGSLNLTEVYEETRNITSSVNAGADRHTGVFFVEDSPITFRAGRGLEGEGEHTTKRRYDTRASNRNWTWKKAARARFGSSGGTRETRGESSKEGSRRSKSSL